MTDFELLIMNELSEIKTAIAASSAVIPTLQASLAEVKAGIADDKKSEKIKDYIHYASAPVLISLQSILRHMGVHV